MDDLWRKLSSKSFKIWNEKFLPKDIKNKTISFFISSNWNIYGIFRRYHTDFVQTFFNHEYFENCRWESSSTSHLTPLKLKLLHFLNFLFKRKNDKFAYLGCDARQRSISVARFFGGEIFSTRHSELTILVRFLVMKRAPCVTISSISSPSQQTFVESFHIHFCFSAFLQNFEH